MTNSSWAATYTYTPTTVNGTDPWSTGTGWTPGAPVSDPSTTLSFGTTGNSITGTYTSDDDNTYGGSTALGPNSGFQLNTLNLNGTGGTTGGVVNITNSGGFPLEFESTGGTPPAINLNATNGSAALTYNVNTPLFLDANTTITGNGTATTNFDGLLNGTGNILKTGTSTVNFDGGIITTTAGAVGTTSGTTTATVNSGNYAGSVDVEGGVFQVNSSGTNNGGTTNGTSFFGQFYTSGTLTVGAAGTFSVQGTNNPTAGFSALTGTGTITSGINRFIAINYNGAGSDTFAGTFAAAGTSFTKEGLGTLDLTGATLPLNGSGFGASTSQLDMIGGTLNARSLAYFTTFQVTNGTINLTPAASGAAFSGNVGNANYLTGGSVLSIVPTEPSGSAGTAMTQTIEATGGNVLREHSGVFSLDLGNASSLTLAFGNSSNYGGNGAVFTVDGLTNGHGALFLIEPGSAVSSTTGINALGGAIKIVEIAASRETRVDDVSVVNNPTVNGGMVDAGVIAQNNDVNRSGTFLTYSGTNVAGDTGFLPVTFDDTTTTATAGTSAFATGTTTNTTKEHVTASGTVALGATTTVYALQNEGAAITIPSGGTLNLGPNNANIRGGLILNGGSISGGTIALGANAGGAFYVSGANGSITSNITGGGQITVQGPGVLSLSGTVAPGLAVEGSTLESVTAATTSGSTTTLAQAGSNLQGISLENGVFQSYSSTGTTTGFTRAVGFQPYNIYFSQTAGAGGGFAARGGALNIALGGSFNTTTGVASGGQTLIWGTTSNFVSDQSQMTFGSPTANNVVNFTNPLSLGGSTPNYTRIVNTIAGAGGDLTVFSGVITTGSNATATANGNNGTGLLNILAKTGAGTLALTANNLYTGGTAVNQGTLLINNVPVSGAGSGTGTGAVSVVGGTLGGTGQIAGAVTIGIGAAITGGTIGSVGTLTLGSTATINGSYLVDILGTGSDNLKLGGTLAIGSGALITFSGNATASSYDLANYTSESGTFTTTNLPSGYQLVYGATELDLRAVPEPSTWAAIVTGAGLLVLVRRRRFAVQPES